MCIRKHVFGSAVMFLMMAAVAWSQNSATANPGAADRAFMNKAAEGGMAEVRMGQLAQQNARSQQVKDFGSRMVTDHTAAGDKLKQVAGEQNVTLPNQLSAKDQAMLDRMSKLHGAAFDKAYMHDMVQDHETDVAEFKREEKTAKDPQLKDWVSSTLPTLEDHLAEAKKVAASIGATDVASKAHAQPAANNLQNNQPQ